MVIRCGLVALLQHLFGAQEVLAIKAAEVLDFSTPTQLLNQVVGVVTDARQGRAHGFSIEQQVHWLGCPIGRRGLSALKCGRGVYQA